jgi:membrane protein
MKNITSQPIVKFALQVFQEWNEDKVPRLAAALSYYTVFSLAPLLIVVIAIAGLFFGASAAQNQVIGQIQSLIGAQGAQLIAGVLSQTHTISSDLIATAIAIVTIVLGATGVVGELKDSLNTIWNVAPKPGGGLFRTVFDKFLSLGMVLGLGFLLLVSLVISTLLGAVGKWVGGYFGQWVFVAQIFDVLISFGGVALLFALLFKFLPDVKVAWRDVWIGALVTALLFTIGKYALGYYLSNSNLATPFGAAGSLVILFVWIYYAAQILFLGAEITQVYANVYGRGVHPASDAIALSDAARVEQGTKAPTSTPSKLPTTVQPVIQPAPRPSQTVRGSAFNPARLVLGAIGVGVFSVAQKAIGRVTHTRATPLPKSR